MFKAIVATNKFILSRISHKRVCVSKHPHDQATNTSIAKANKHNYNSRYKKFLFHRNFLVKSTTFVISEYAPIQRDLQSYLMNITTISTISYEEFPSNTTTLGATNHP